MSEHLVHVHYREIQITQQPIALLGVDNDVGFLNTASPMPVGTVLTVRDVNDPEWRREARVLRTIEPCRVLTDRIPGMRVALSPVPVPEPVPVPVPEPVPEPVAEPVPVPVPEPEPEPEPVAESARSTRETEIGMPPAAHQVSAALEGAKTEVDEPLPPPAVEGDGAGEEGSAGDPGGGAKGAGGGTKRKRRKRRK